MMLKNKINFPSSEEIQRNFQELEDPTFQGSTLVITEEAPLLAQIKYDLCQNILAYQQKEQLELKHLAVLLDLEESKTKELLNCQIYKFSLNDLIGYSQKLHFKLKVKIIAEQSTL